jgi:N-acetylmuramoyl-L-alanine amidase
MRPAGLAIAVVFCLSAAGAGAQPPPVERLFIDASAKEQAVRTALSNPGVTDAALKAVRTVVADYEAIVRRFPTSAYCDDALWRAGQLLLEAHARFGAAEDKAAAIRLLRTVASQYPSSKFAKQAPAVIAAAESRSEPAKNSVQDVPVKTTGTASAPAVVTIRDIRRVVLPDAVRIVIELDGEVPAFHDERLDNPVRVFVDLSATRAAAELIDRTIRFESDSDVVRQVRLGRHPNATTRVVVDASGVSSYSVYPLYSPYRLVIDFVKDRAPVPDVPLQGRRVVAPTVASMPPAPVMPLQVPTPAAPREAPVPRLLERRIIAPTAASMPRVSSPFPLAPKETRLLPLVSTPIKTRPIVIDAAPSASLTAALEGMIAAERSVKAPASAAPSTTPTPLPAATTTASTSPPAATTVPATAAPSTTTAPGVPPQPNIAGGFSMARQLGLGVSKIVIDPGHGGHDPGGVVRGATEAAIVLDVALRLEKLLEKVPGVEVILTRRTDDFLPLQERTAIANRESADLFLSIHANANNNTRASGVETYFLNFATNSSAAAIAARENANSGQAMGELPDFVKMIALNNKMDESRDFATFVQRSMIAQLTPGYRELKDLGVKQAPFVVLIGASMPSVLAEISFLTHVQEGRLLRTQAYRQKIAEALFEAIRKYQTSLKTDGKVATQQ